LNAAAAVPAASPGSGGAGVAVGRIVHVETMVDGNPRLAPAIVTNVHGGVFDYVNATLFPDLAPPQPMGSIPRKDLARPGWQGAVWSWPPRV